MGWRFLIIITLLLIISVTYLGSYVRASEAIATHITPIRCVVGGDGVLRVFSAGVANALALVVGNHVALCLWGEVGISIANHSIVIAPVYPRSLAAVIRGKPVVLSSAMITYYGTAYESGKNFVEWRSRIPGVVGGAMVSWIGSGSTVGETRSTALLFLIASLRINTSKLVNEMRRVTSLTPITTLIDPHGSVEVYGVGLLYPKLDLERVYGPREIVSMVSKGYAVFSLVILWDRDSNVSIIISGASMDLVKVGTRILLKLSLGLVRRSNTTSPGVLEIDSYALALVTSSPLSTVTKIALNAVKHSTNPLIALQLVWRALGTGVARTITITVTSTKTIEKSLEPFEAAAITMVSLVIGIVVGMVLTRYATRSRSTS